MHDLRSFLTQLEQSGDLRRITEPVSPHLEMTALCDRVLRAGGPALLFENPSGHRMPVLANLFGTPERVARAMGVDSIAGLRPFGELLASLKEPEAPKGFKEMVGMSSLLKTLWNMAAARHARNWCGRAQMWTLRACPSSTAGRVTWRR